MSTNDLTSWLHGLKRGDPRAVEQIWHEYFCKLSRLIAERLGNLPLRIVDEEDLALSALNSLCEGVKAGRFPKLDDRDDLWKILVAIACRKATAFRRKFYAQKRGAGQVRGESGFGPLEEPMEGIEQVLGREPTPEFAMVVAETMRNLLDRLGNSTLQAIATFKMEGYSNEEIAVQLGCTTRTVERKLSQIRQLWSDQGS